MDFHSRRAEHKTIVVKYSRVLLQAAGARGDGVPNIFAKFIDVTLQFCENDCNDVGITRFDSTINCTLSRAHARAVAIYIGIYNNIIYTLAREECSQGLFMLKLNFIAVYLRFCARLFIHVRGNDFDNHAVFQLFCNKRGDKTFSLYIILLSCVYNSVLHSQSV